MRFIPWDADKWLSREGSILPWDKLEHFMLGIIGALGLSIFFSVFVVVLIAIIAAVSWEIKDSFVTGFSFKDLIAGISGALIGIFLSTLF